MLVHEDGPFDIFERFRHFLGIRYTERSNRYGTNVLAKLFMCVWCLSVWVGIAVTVLYVLLGEIAIYICLPFAISGGAVILERLTE
jgi:hypothetical protein